MFDGKKNGTRSTDAVKRRSSLLSIRPPLASSGAQWLNEPQKTERSEERLSRQSISQPMAKVEREPVFAKAVSARGDDVRSPAEETIRKSSVFGSWRKRLDDRRTARKEASRKPVSIKEPEISETREIPASHRTVLVSNDGWQPLIDPGVVFKGIGRSRLSITLCTLIGASLGVLMALNTPRMYEAATDLLIDPRNLQIVDRELSQSGLSSDAALALIQNQMRIITSGNVLSRVVDSLKLEQDPEFNGRNSGVDLNPVNWLRTAFSQSGASNPAIGRAITIDNLSRHISVMRDTSTFVVTIWASAQDSEKAADIANAMSTAYLETSAQFQAEIAGRATDELTSRLDALREQVEEAEREVEAFKAQNGIIDAQGRLITDEEILRLNDQLSVARARTAELTARAASAGSLNVDAVVGGSLPEQVNSPVLGQLRAQYAALKQEADRLAVRLGPRHPQRLAAEAQLQGSREQIAGELQRITNSLQIELTRARQLETELSSRLDDLKTRQGDLSRERVTLRELERDAASKRSVYEAFLLRSRETGEQRNINTANISVISPATPPLKPSGLSRVRIVMVGMILGLFVGLGIALLRGAWDSLRQSRMHRHNLAEAIAHDNDADRPSGANSWSSGGPYRPYAYPQPGSSRNTEEIRESLRELKQAVEDLRVKRF